jgi:uncharacterized membrane protein
MMGFLKNEKGKLSMGRLGVLLGLVSGVALVVVGIIGFFLGNDQTIAVLGIAGGFFGVSGGVKAAQGAQ